MNTLLRSWLASVLLLLLSACGPGTGGTGSGDGAGFLSAAGASASPVCGAPWASLLLCKSIGASAPGLSANDPGTPRLQFFSGSGAGAADYVLTFEGNRISLTGGCPRISFDGEWGSTPAGKTAFYGGYLDRKLVQAIAAQLAVEGPSTATPASLQLSLRLSDTQAVLLPVLTAQKANTEVQAKPCP